MDAARAAAKRCGKGRGGTKLKGYDLAGFKREVLAEVRNTIRDASATSSEPASGRGSTVESDGGDGNGSEKQGTAARRERLGTEIQELRKVLGPDHVEVTKRRAELESLRQQRLLHTRVLDGQRRIEKATEKVEMWRKELAEAEELLRMAHERRDKAFRECEVAEREVLHAREGQEELAGEFRGADAQPGHAGPCLLGVRDALDRLFQRASGDEARNVAKQLVEMAKSELAPLEYSLKRSRGHAGAEQEVVDVASEPGTDDLEAWTNDVVDVVGEESRERVRSRVAKRIGESGWQLVRKTGKSAGPDGRVAGARS